MEHLLSSRNRTDSAGVFSLAPGIAVIQGAEIGTSQPCRQVPVIKQDCS